MVLKGGEVLAFSRCGLQPTGWFVLQGDNYSSSSFNSATALSAPEHTRGTAALCLCVAGRQVLRDRSTTSGSFWAGRLSNIDRYSHKSYEVRRLHTLQGKHFPTDLVLLQEVGIKTT